MPKKNQNQISTFLHLNLSDNTLACTIVFELYVTFQGTEFPEGENTCKELMKTKSILKNTATTKNPKTLCSQT